MSRDFHSFGDESIRWSLIAMLLFRKNMQDMSTLIDVDHFNKTDQFALKVSPNEFASLQVSCCLLLHYVEALSIVPKPPSLPHRSLIVNIHNSLHEVIIVLHSPDIHSQFRSLLNVPPGVLGQSTFPPTLEACYRNDSRIIPFKVVPIFGFNVAKRLSKGENVCF